MAAFYAAKKYAAPRFENKCRGYITSHLSVDDVCTVLDQAVMFNDEKLQTNCLEFILKNSASVLQSSGFLELNAASLEKVLEGEHLTGLEEPVFDAVLSWADAECGRRKLELTGENRRTVLGRLLYLIRFPAMDRMYYQNTVAPLNILSSEENKDLHDYHFETGATLCTRFVTLGRPKRCMRFQSLCKFELPNRLGFDGDGAISFTASHDISLYGVMVYGLAGDRKSNEKHDAIVIITVYDAKCTLVSKIKKGIANNAKKPKSKVILPAPVLVQAGQEYTINVKTFHEYSNFWGTGGMESVTVGHITFNFSESKQFPSYIAAVEEGQVAGLLYR
jgi:hypothetical protein